MGIKSMCVGGGREQVSQSFTSLTVFLEHQKQQCFSYPCKGLESESLRSLLRWINLMASIPQIWKNGISLISGVLQKDGLRQK